MELRSIAKEIELVGWISVIFRMLSVFRERWYKSFFSLPDARHNDLMVATKGLIEDRTGYRDNLRRESARARNRFHLLIHQRYPFTKRTFSNPFSKSTLSFWKRFARPAPSGS